MKLHTDAAGVVAFDFKTRNRDLTRRIRRAKPVTFVHNDYTHDLGPQRVRDIIGRPGAEALVKGFGRLNV
ncbi:MAG: hypothetical protein ACI8Z1_000743 [Candidatus Azotimanducaceae bacterium]